MTNQSLTEKQIAKEIRSATLKGHCYLIRGAGTDKARIFDAKTQAGRKWIGENTQDETAA